MNQKKLVLTGKYRKKDTQFEINKLDFSMI